VSRRRFPIALAAALVATQAYAQEMSPPLRAQVDAAIRQVVAKTGVPSASVGIVQGGRIVFTQAYGDARLKPELKATAAMTYPVGSISKQFTATCILLLEQDGKLSLDDKVARWFPHLTRAGDVTVREILSHTSGYEDYAPQDYTIPAWMQPTDPLKTVQEWAGKPLDFEPGTQWQYSNTNFVLAALIVQKASGMPYFDFLRTRVLEPAGLTGAINLDTQRDRVEPEGYERRALAPLRPAVLEAPGWYFGDASLAMPVADLLRWDISIMDRTLLKPAGYEQFETDVKLRNGKPSHYGLGISVFRENGHLMLEHSGEVGGFVSENVVWPDRRIALAILTNQEASSAAEEIAKALAPLLLPKTVAAAAPALPEEAQLRTILTGLQAGKIDPTLFTADANFYFSAETLGDFASSLQPLGAVTEVKRESEQLRGGMVYRSFTAAFAGGKKVTVSTYTMKDGKLEQLLVEGEAE
jgi:CubicO group peptidase (beta-lactamase class C family)